jgi:hypothetical protein
MTAKKKRDDGGLRLLLTREIFKRRWRILVHNVQFLKCAICRPASQTTSDAKLLLKKDDAFHHVDELLNPRVSSELIYKRN